MASAFACGPLAPTRAHSASRCGIAVLIRRPRCCNADMDSCSERRAAAAREAARWVWATHIVSTIFPKCLFSHMRLRRRSLVERKAAVDRQSELARGHRLPQIGVHAATDLTHFLERAGPE